MACPALFAKIFPFAADPNQLHIQTVSSRSRGVSRSSRTRGGMRWTRQRQALSGDGRAGRKARELTNGTQTDGAVARRSLWLRWVRGRRSRVVLAPVAGVKSVEVKSARPGLDKPLICG